MSEMIADIQKLEAIVISDDMAREVIERKTVRGAYEYMREMAGYPKGSYQTIPDEVRTWLHRAIADLTERMSRLINEAHVDVIVRKLQSVGISKDLIKVTYGSSIHIRILNDHFTGLFNEWGTTVGLAEQIIGLITVTTDLAMKPADYLYEFVNTPRVARRYRDTMRRTIRLETLFLKIDEQLPVVTFEMTEAKRKEIAAERAASRERDRLATRRYALERLVKEHGKRAMELLSQANVEIPDDFKEAMSDFLDLTTEG